MSGTIILLEDTDKRTDWLRDVLVGYNVVGCKTVATFLEAVKNRPEDLKLVIFDHDLGRTRSPQGMYDLGSSAPNYDPDGKSGHDAAHEVEAFGVPALVWSWNASGARAIATVLSRERKATLIQIAPFKASEEFAAVIGKLLR